MKEEPIVAAVRRIETGTCRAVWLRLDLIVEELKAQEQASGRQYIRLPSRRLADQKMEPSAAIDYDALDTSGRVNWIEPTGDGRERRRKIAPPLASRGGQRDVRARRVGDHRESGVK